VAARHGAGLYVLSDPYDEDNLENQELFGDSGPIPPEVALYDREAQSVVFIGGSSERFAQINALPGAGPQSKTKIPVYEYIWRFGRAADDELPDRAGLSALAEAMIWQGVHDDANWSTASSNIPAGYTYLGQFIAHELSRFVDPINEADPASINSPSLDLDSIYRHPRIQRNGIELAIGSTDQGRMEDLPRDAAGKPEISDPRNDDNLPLAQTHVAFLKFHNRAARLMMKGGHKLDVDDVKFEVVKHFQSIVLHDYAKRIIQSEIYEDVCQNGRRIVYPKGEYPASKTDFKLPIEFAAAAFRFGHSMVRESYEKWNGQNNGGLDVFWAKTHNSSRDPKPIVLDDLWVNIWERLLCFKGTRWADRQSDQDPIMASPIDDHLAFGLGQIREEALPISNAEPRFTSNNLAARTLDRALTLRLKSAQDVIRKINHEVGGSTPPIPLLHDWQLFEAERPCVQRAASHRYGWPRSIVRHTPLWFYILKEAQILGDGGNTLGPLGSRIVMESIHSAIQFSRISILNDNQEVDWRPRLEFAPNEKHIYTFPDMIMFIGE